MRYAAIVHREGKHTLAEFPDCGGCHTFVKGKQPIEPMAREALAGWLGSHLLVPDKKRRPSDIPPRPSTDVQAPRGKRRIWVELPAELTLKLELLWARTKADLSRKQLAKRAGVSRRAIAMLEDPAYHPSLGEFERVFAALRSRPVVQLERLPDKGEYLVVGPIRMQPIHPGRLAAEQFPEMGISDAKAARALGLSRRDFEKLRAGQLTITLELARSIGAVVGNGPGIWLRMQQTHDLWHLEHDANHPRQKPGRNPKAVAVGE